jgi:hypothetical protein
MSARRRYSATAAPRYRWLPEVYAALIVYASCIRSRAGGFRGVGPLDFVILRARLDPLRPGLQPAGYLPIGSAVRRPGAQRPRLRVGMDGAGTMLSFDGALQLPAAASPRTSTFAQR